MIKNLLKFWYDCEFFNPSWPVDANIDIDLLKHDTPWKTSQDNPKIRVAYDVYFGMARIRDISLKLTESLKIEEDADESGNADHSCACFFAVKISQDGEYIDTSFAISPFIWAVCQLLKTQSLGTNLSADELENIQNEVNLKVTEIISQPITLQGLHDLYDYVCRCIDVPERLLERSIWAKKKVQYANKNGSFREMDSSTELMQSFLQKDIMKIQQQITPQVNNYATTLNSSDKKNKRIEIDTNTEEMQNALQANKFPLGAWPSLYSPSLMQQIAINLSVSESSKIFSVNGPPGTGKTTLLKEIVASNVVQRAKLLMSFVEPDDAFRKCKFQNPVDEYTTTYYEMNRRLFQYGMIVVSNNNAAVENISVELPKLMTADRTGRFSKYSENAQDVYFSDIATALVGEPSWGLISAKMGKKENIKALVNLLWGEKNLLISKFSQHKSDWIHVKNNFREAEKRVCAFRAKIEKAQEQTIELKKAMKTLSVSQHLESQTYEEYAKQQIVLKTIEQEIILLEEKVTINKKRIDAIKASLPWYLRLLRKFLAKNPLVREWTQTEKDILNSNVAITNKELDCYNQKQFVNRLQQSFEKCQIITKADMQKADIIKDKLGPVVKILGANYPDDSFWTNIEQNKTSQIACPWTCSEYDRLREELFFQALMIHKEFVLSSYAVRQNLMRLFKMWENKFDKTDRQNAGADLLNTLLLLIPVISTTFASVQSFLEYLNPGDVGMIIADEAGQATPQSALGALWRTDKAIVVGDPLQVEPIVGIPKFLRRLLADKYKIPSEYRSETISVQGLADACNQYGGYRYVEESSIWLGCPLTVHRRCIEPMFSIINNVAYNGRMINQTKDQASNCTLLLKESTWFDVKGVAKGSGNKNGKKDHTVMEQNTLVVALIEQAMEIFNELPDIFIITPFTTVEKSIKRMLRPIFRRRFPKLEDDKIEEWLKSNCGTIHTFQGKEKNEVLIVLGCDERSGHGAARWVGAKPNIINVAVSRAIYRVGVIGDMDLWKKIPYVSTVCTHLSSNIRRE